MLKKYFYLNSDVSGPQDLSSSSGSLLKMFAFTALQHEGCRFDSWLVVFLHGACLCKQTHICYLSALIRIIQIKGETS